MFRDTRIPYIMHEEEMSRFFSVIDRTTPIGKRDYALLLLAAKTGLRTTDIRHLQFKNLRWDTNTIEIVQNKTGQALVLPLFEDVGLAIIEYVKTARPQNGEPHIFIGTRAPHRPRLSPLNLLVKKYMSIAQIGSESCNLGLRIFRNSLASNMLDQGIALPIISSVLGHSSAESTKRYLKVHLGELRQCALEVPHV